MKSGSSNLESGPNNEPEVRHFHRLWPAAVVLGAAALAAVYGYHQKSHNHPAGPITDHRHIYHSGDSLPITPGLTARVSGRQVIFRNQDLLNFLSQHQHAEVDITMHNAQGAEQELTLKDGQAIGLINLDTLDQQLDVAMDCNPPPGPDCFITVQRQTARYNNQLKLIRTPSPSRILEIKPDATI